MKMVRYLRWVWISSRSSSAQCQTVAVIKEDEQSTDGNNRDEIFSVSPVLSVSSDSAKSVQPKIEGSKTPLQGSTGVTVEPKSAGSATNAFPFAAINAGGYGSHLFPLPHRYLCDFHSATSTPCYHCPPLPKSNVHLRRLWHQSLLDSHINTPNSNHNNSNNNEEKWRY